jgi:hypothetical protein
VRAPRSGLTWCFADEHSARSQVDEAYRVVPGQGG